ncbi:MAG: class I tRNA ligase family protein, partial [Thermoplasmatota archaeon]
PMDCPKCKTPQGMLREPYVIDVWYDSGAAQFAQWNATGVDNPHLQEQWPIDFVAEGLDQTRGWFYSLLACGTALGKALPQGPFRGPAFRNCVVNGLILAEDGQKMAKSKRNYVPPDQVFATQGADATRWYLLSTTAPWQDKRFYEEGVREVFGKFFSTLWNTFLFQHQYARLDRWKPDGAPATRSPLDAWLWSRFNAVVQEVRFEADRYHLHKATRALEAFLVDDLSNWWLRRSRDRFWKEHDSEDKKAAHRTLWQVLHGLVRLVAPFAPFMVEVMWPHLRLESDPPSVHLALLPEAEAAGRDERAEREMAQVRQVAEAGRALRSRVNIPTRHPLGRAVLVGTSLGAFASILQDEINVKSLESAHSASAFRRHVAKPNRAALGRAFKAMAPQVADAIEALDGDHAYAQITQGRTVGVNVDGHDHEVGADQILFEERDRDGWATVDVEGVLLALHVERDEMLLAEALAREVLRRLQDLRRELDLEIDEEVDVTLSAGPEEEAKLAHFLHVLKSDARARSLAFAPGPQARTWDIDGIAIGCTLKPTRTHRPEGIEAA